MSGVDVGQLFRELQRRQVFRALAAYAAVGWLLIEVASVVVPVMEWPQRVIRLLIYVVVAGLPVCLVGAWFLDLTPVGIRREPASDEDSIGAPGTNGTGTSRAFYGFLAGLLVAALGLALYSGSRPTDSAPTLAEAELLARDGDYLEAFTIMAGMPEDVLRGPDVEPLWLTTSDRLTLVTEPAGARVRGEYLADAGQAPVRVDLGTTPLIDIAVARHDLLLTIEADGFESRELLVSGRFDRQEGFLADQAVLEFQLALRPEVSAAPSRSLSVPGGTYMLVSADIPTGQAAELEDFEIDRFEVSNEDYLAFVRAGGYRDDRHWDAAAHLGTASRSAMTDQTGLPGPVLWSGQ